MQFTVIVPIYKVEEYLERCVDSILNQTFSDFEVILVDDGSPDRCPQICDEYEKKDKRVRVIHKPNGGLVSARNAGIFAAKGDYITYVDGDDWVKPNLLQFVHDRIAESTDPVDMIIFSAEKVYSGHTEPMSNQVEAGWYNRERLEKVIFPYLLIKWRDDGSVGHMVQGFTWNKPCRRELQVEHYVRDERIRMFTDEPLTYECLLNCQNVYICDEPLYLYNQCNFNSILALGKKNYLTRSFGYLVAYMQERLKGYSPVIDRQLIEYPIRLITRTAKQKIQTEASFRQAVKSIRTGLKESGMLQYIHLKDVPWNSKKLMLLLFKMHLFTPGMLLCAIKVRKEREKAKN